MKIKIYVVELDLSARQRKIVRAAVVTGTAIAALGIGIAVAAPLDTSWIGAGSQVSASSLLADMTELNRRTIATNGGVSYSVGATKYCGDTATSFTGSLGGYPGAKQACQGVATGCGSSSTAHMCAADEIARSAQLGIAMPSGWYSNAIAAPGSASATTDDCMGWGASTSNYIGPWWNSFPAGDYCNASHPILCCD